MPKKTHIIENLNAMLKSRDKTIDSLIADKNQYREENKKLRFDLEECKELLKEIVYVSSSNTYNNEKVALRIINELATITTMY